MLVRTLRRLLVALALVFVAAPVAPAEAARPSKSRSAKSRKAKRTAKKVTRKRPAKKVARKRPAKKVARKTAVKKAPATPGVQEGRASYYARRFHGRRTASGERYDERAMTCAHPTLPFGTSVKVEHSGRSVVLRVNDRGPFGGRRIVDLSRAAAQTLGLIEKGEGKVRLTVLRRGR